MGLWERKTKKGTPIYITGKGNFYHLTRDKNMALDESEIPEEHKQRFERRFGY